MDNRLKKASLYGVWFMTLGPLMGFLILALFIAPIFLFYAEDVMRYTTMMELLQVVFGVLLAGYIIFGLPAFFTGVVFGYVCHRPYSSLISGCVAACLAFIFAFAVACVGNGFYGSFSHYMENALIGLGFAVLAFIFGTFLAFIFKEKFEMPFAG